eukprot:766667-Hanusia_phi.AAC.4
MKLVCRRLGIEKWPYKHTGRRQRKSQMTLDPMGELRWDGIPLVHLPRHSDGRWEGQWSDRVVVSAFDVSDIESQREEPSTSPDSPGRGCDHAATAALHG